MIRMRRVSTGSTVHTSVSVITTRGITDLLSGLDTVRITDGAGTWVGATRTIHPGIRRIITDITARGITTRGATVPTITIITIIILITTGLFTVLRVRGYPLRLIVAVADRLMPPPDTALHREQAQAFRLRREEAQQALLPVLLRATRRTVAVPPLQVTRARQHRRLRRVTGNLPQRAQRLHAPLPAQRLHVPLQA